MPTKYTSQIICPYCKKIFKTKSNSPILQDSTWFWDIESHKTFCSEEHLKQYRLTKLLEGNDYDYTKNFTEEATEIQKRIYKALSVKYYGGNSD